MQNTLSIIGCGKMGQTLGRLWADARQFSLLDVLNRSLPSSQKAVTFIGAGRAITTYEELGAADIYLIGSPDDDIAICCEALAATGLLSSSSVVFHCSGALSASALRAAAQCGASVASIHPIRSFARPEQLVREFAGTWCGTEGDQRAVDLLARRFTAIGANLVAIDSDKKILYHAAAVFASNYLVTLLDVAQQAYIEAGIVPEVALKLMEPLVRESTDNVFMLGPQSALTGPAARGDLATVERQLDAVTGWKHAYGELYGNFAALALELAARKTKN